MVLGYSPHLKASFFWPDTSMGWRQRDHATMVFHESGTRMLIKGQTDPHVIFGVKFEYDGGFS